MNGFLIVNKKNALRGCRDSFFHRDFNRVIREFQDERRPFADPVTMDAERAAQFIGGVGATMQAKTMSGLLGGVSVRKDASQVFRRNPDGIIDDVDQQLVLPASSVVRRISLRSV